MHTRQCSNSYENTKTTTTARSRLCEIFYEGERLRDIQGYTKRMFKTNLGDDEILDSYYI